MILDLPLLSNMKGREKTKFVMKRLRNGGGIRMGLGMNCGALNSTKEHKLSTVIKKGQRIRID